MHTASFHDLPKSEKGIWHLGSTAHQHAHSNRVEWALIYKEALVRSGRMTQLPLRKLVTTAKELRQGKEADKVTYSHQSFNIVVVTLNWGLEGKLRHDESTLQKIRATFYEDDSLLSGNDATEIQRALEMLADGFRIVKCKMKATKTKVRKQDKFTSYLSMMAGVLPEDYWHRNLPMGSCVATDYRQPRGWPTQQVPCCCVKRYVDRMLGNRLSFWI